MKVLSQNLCIIFLILPLGYLSTNLCLNAYVSVTVCKAASHSYIVPSLWYDMSVSLSPGWDANKRFSDKSRLGRDCLDIDDDRISIQLSDSFTHGHSFKDSFLKNLENET